MNKSGKKQVVAKEKAAKQTSRKIKNIVFTKIEVFLIPLLEKWLFAISIIFTPKAIALALITISLLWYTKSQEGSIRIILEIFVIVSSSTFTAIVVQNLIEAKGNTVLAKKSVASIRYLQSLKYKIKNVADRIKAFNKDGDRDFEEILNLVGNIDKDVVNSILDWADINPASVGISIDYFEDTRLQEEIISKLKSDQKKLVEQKAELDQGKKAEIKKLEKEIAEKESEMSELQNILSERSLGDLSIVSGTSPTPFSGPTISGYIVNSCRNCGRPLSLFDQYDANPETQGLCAQCKGIFKE